ncbi:MAG: tetratricopeptide repeat protein [Planctomycetes bacterium]|nr:tetratricopeptide repeat protein [Planctomycetota bacterium]MCC7173341.1 tetratricopeptide repeat protein [Planctomycetota bacterium]
MSDAQASFKEGFKAFTTGDYAGAIAKFEHALGLDPDHRDALRSIAMAQLRQGNAERAVEYAKRLSELEPNDPMSWSSLSLFLMKAGRPKEAEDAAARAKVQTWKVQLKQKPGETPTGQLQVLDTPSAATGGPGAPVMPSAPMMPTLKPAQPHPDPSDPDRPHST